MNLETRVTILPIIEGETQTIDVGTVLAKQLDRGFGMVVGSIEHIVDEPTGLFI